MWTRLARSRRTHWVNKKFSKNFQKRKQFRKFPKFPNTEKINGNYLFSENFSIKGKKKQIYSKNRNFFEEKYTFLIPFPFALLLCSYCVGQLLLPDYSLPWEHPDWAYPSNMATPLQIEIEASNGILKTLWRNFFPFFVA